jgi:hypothetical protein
MRFILPVSRAGFYVFGDKAYEIAIKESVVWMRNRVPEIPVTALAGDPFYAGYGSNFHAESLTYKDDDVTIWTALLEDKREFGPAQRSWITELTVGIKSDQAAFSARLFCTTNELVEVSRSRPGCVQQVIETVRSEMDGWVLSAEPHYISADDSVSSFIELICDSRREMPVIAISEKDNGLVDVDTYNLARRTSGLCHLCVISSAASDEIGQRIGKHNSVFNGSVRTYYPGFEESGNPYAHPILINRGHKFTDEQIEIITNSILGNSARQRLSMNSLPRYGEIRTYIARQAVVGKHRQVSVATIEQIEVEKLYQNEIDALSKKINEDRAENDALLTGASREIDALKATNAELESKISYLNQYIRIADKRLKENAISSIDEPLKVFSDFDDWQQRHLSGKIWVAGKAIREVEKHRAFADPELFGKALLLIRDFFVESKLNPGPIAFKALQEACKSFGSGGIEDDACFVNRQDIKRYPEYKVTYKGVEYWCEDHFKYGGGTDPRKMFRIYYHWHSGDQILLIGHMPTHLDNNMTN